jgi:hypothetical protein
MFSPAQYRVKKLLYKQTQLCGMVAGPEDLNAVDPISAVPSTSYQYNPRP